MWGEISLSTSFILIQTYVIVMYYPDGPYEHFVNDIVVDGNHYGYKI